MKSLRGRHVYLAVLALLILLFHLLADQKPLMTAIAAGTLALRQGLARLCALAPFSVAELLAALAILAVLAWAVWTGVSLLRAGGRRLRLLWRRVSLLLAVGMAVYLLLCLLLGASYRADSFQDRSGLAVQPRTVNALYETAAVFVERLRSSADAVPRDEDGLFAQPLDAIFNQAKDIYRGAEALFPFLALRDCAPKRLVCSRLLSQFNYTGFYFPFTGEANINVDVFPCMIPATIAHEMAHQRGVASEQEANFVAILACTTSGSPVYAYSGWLFGFLHLGGALYRVDPARYYQLLEQLPGTVLSDIQANNDYWADFETKVAQVSERVYDSFLKSYGQTLGVQSYGAVVDLLLTWQETQGF